MRCCSFILVFLLGFISPLSAQEPNILVFHKTAGFHHVSIPKGIQTLQELGKENNFKVYETDNAEFFSSEELKKFKLVVFLNTTGNVLDPQQQNAFERYIENGGNFFGIHAAADTEFDWKWYGDLVGAYFLDHPEIQKAKITVVDPANPAVSHFEGSFDRVDEWYNYRQINPENKVLLNLEESSYKGGKNGKYHPIAWYRELSGGGRAVYTGGGHTTESYNEPQFREHLRRSILFAMGIMD